MKKCPKCKEDVTEGAKKCKHCGSDLRNWFSQHPLLTSVLALVIIGIAIGATGQNASVEPTKVGEVESEKADTTKDIKEETKAYTIGESIKLGNNVITVHSVAGYTSGNEFLAPSSGKKFITADISQENAGDEATDYNTYDFKLQDNQDYAYDQAISDKEPSFGSGSLQTGQKTRGFITFEIPTANTPSKLIFTPSFWNNEQIIVSLQ